MAVFTTRLNLAKPAGGSSGTIPGDDQADIDVLNDNADKIDAAMGTLRVASGGKPATPYDGQTIGLTDANNMIQLRAAGAWVNPGIIGFGTAAQRDAYYPTPGSAAARVALAATVPLWFNTQKGILEQYFAQFDDAGAGIFSKKVFGWRPSQLYGRQAMPVTGSVGGGTPANVKKYGTSVELVTPGSNAVTVDGVFTADFDAYDIEFELYTAAAANDMSFQFRSGGVTYAGAFYDHERYGVVSTSVTAVGSSGATSFGGVSAVSAANGAQIRMRVLNPMTAVNKRVEFWGGNGGALLAGTGLLRNTGLMDGFTFTNASALIGAIRVFGVSNGL